ncbi:MULTISPECIES: hypothetical protein [Myroides]|uniref:Uncharacterized protein n=1 Tax=Myroides albus TaxID=2562892 RepID=A0A6I3LGD0_9FLAO|nr:MULTISPECIES: hypothetical protein [Myroides]MTG97233.1 hypothetical protein [Myroides albus]MVX36790.1 hypothetical protein [Myroides sp. LoEW2-1]
MEIEKQHQYFIQALNNRLCLLQQNMVANLKMLFEGDYLPLKNEYSFESIECFYFEYMYDSLDIVVWAQDIQEDVISIGAKKMLSDISDSIFSKELDRAFYDLEEQWGETEEELDAFDKLTEQLDQSKDEILTKWFVECWIEAKKDSAYNQRGFFSIHDTIYRTCLP